MMLIIVIIVSIFALLHRGIVLRLLNKAAETKEVKQMKAGLQKAQWALIGKKNKSVQEIERLLQIFEAKCADYEGILDTLKVDFEQGGHETCARFLACRSAQHREILAPASVAERSILCSR